jgi:hypothetical protein
VSTKTYASPRQSDNCAKMARTARLAQVDFPADLAFKLADRRRDRDSYLWAEHVADALDRLPHGVVIPIGDTGMDDDTAAVVAHEAVDAITAALRQRWFLEALVPEYDKPQASIVAAGRRTRTLLPHHDGGNSSYLTPSRLDVPDWSTDDRRTFPPNITTTRMHKLYQGFHVREVGEGESLTPYYELVGILIFALMHQSRAASVPMATLYRACAKNLRRAIEMIRRWGGGYIQLAALLGARDPKYILINCHNPDDAFSAAELSAFPEIRKLSYDGRTPIQRLFEEMIEESTGLSWLSLRERTELCVNTKRNDLVLGHNILLMHGGLGGGSMRVLDPICIVLPYPEGEAYERWLSFAWTTSYQRAVSTLAHAGT